MKRGEGGTEKDEERRGGEGWKEKQYEGGRGGWEKYITMMSEERRVTMGVQDLDSLESGEDSDQ